MCHCWLVTGGLRLSANPSYYLILSSEHLAPNLKILENAPTKRLLRSEYSTPTLKNLGKRL